MLNRVILIGRLTEIQNCDILLRGCVTQFTLAWTGRLQTVKVNERRILFQLSHGGSWPKHVRIICAKGRLDSSGRKHSSSQL